MMKKIFLIVSFLLTLCSKSISVISEGELIEQEGNSHVFL